MSLITRCPACATMFRVVPDQLRISDGWVRCGHCAEVFDASAHLQTQVVAVAPPAEPAPPAAEPQPFVAPPPLPDVHHAAPDALAAAFAAIPADREAEPPALYEPHPAEVRDVIFAAMQRPSREDVVASAIPAEDVEVAGAPTDVAQTPSGEPTLPEAIAEAAPAPEPAAQEPTPSTLEDMSFVRAARRKAFWSRPGVRAASFVVCLLLFVALALQITLHERDRIAAIDARTRPWLDQICVPIGCKVAPLKRIESIVIESSGFNKVRGNSFRFSVALRNKGTVPLATPGIELALTDAQDQTVLRRVLLPAELGAAEVLAPGAEWSAALPVSVTINGQAARIAGYRLLAFYP